MFGDLTELTKAGEKIINVMFNLVKLSIHTLAHSYSNSYRVLVLRFGYKFGYDLTPIISIQAHVTTQCTPPELNFIV